MQTRTRKTLTIWWLVILTCMVLPLPLAPFINIGGLASIGWFAAIPLAIVTFRRSERDRHLQRPGWYRAALGFQLAIASAGALTAAHTVFANGTIGLISIATVQVGTAILTWRAITRPGPRRAIGAAMVAGVVPFIALLIDIALDIHVTLVRTHHLVDDPWGAFAVVSVMLSWIGAGIVCLTAVRVFGEPTNLPDARAI